MKQSLLFPQAEHNAEEMPARAALFPQLRYMGSKFRLLPWIHGVLSELIFESALDGFSGSGCVSYLLKSMGKAVVSNDFLNFPFQIAQATIENSAIHLSEKDCALLLTQSTGREDFVERTFENIFYTPVELRFLDTVWSNLARLRSDAHRSIALSALARACVKRQPRGVFTVRGTSDRYNDGRRDLRIQLADQFIECVQAYNAVIFDNGKRCRAMREDILTGNIPAVDLVYLDPPYVPRSDDNCYIKRYHFLEGLMSYWRDADTTIMPGSVVKKIEKRFTPFSYRSTAVDAFDSLFRRFADSIIVLSYSSNGYPEAETLVKLMSKYKKTVQVHERSHRYHFGTHRNVAVDRAVVTEMLLVGI
jgi:DNA adenine methylase/adenine-specific DNA-methyltransferase